LGLIFQFMVQSTPQQNGQAKHKFAMLFERVWAMLNLAGLVGANEELCRGLWAKCVNMATYMGNVATKQDQEPPF